MISNFNLLLSTGKLTLFYTVKSGKSRVYVESDSTERDSGGRQSGDFNKLILNKLPQKLGPIKMSGQVFPQPNPNSATWEDTARKLRKHQNLKHNTMNHTQGAYLVGPGSRILQNPGHTNLKSGYLSYTFVLLANQGVTIKYMTFFNQVVIEYPHLDWQCYSEGGEVLALRKGQLDGQKY